MSKPSANAKRGGFRRPRLNAVALCPSRLPSRRSRTPRGSISSSVPPTPTPSTSAPPVMLAPLPMPKPSANAKRGGGSRPSSMPSPCALAVYRHADHVRLKGPAPTLCQLLRCRRRPPQPFPSRSLRRRCRRRLPTQERGGFRRPSQIPPPCVPAGYRRADHIDLESPAPALCRQLCSRRRPPQRLVTGYARGCRRGDDHAVVRTRRARAAAHAEAVCKRKEGRLPPPLLNAVALCVSRLPSRRSHRPRESSSRSVPTALQPTPSTPAACHRVRPWVPTT